MARPNIEQPSSRWQAVADRDRSADGHVWYGVTTTGIYCRPQCPSRPKPQNVRFFERREDARAAGFRACRRCHPERDDCPQAPEGVTDRR